MINNQFLSIYPQPHLEPAVGDWLKLVNSPSQQGQASSLAAPLNAFLHMTSTKFKFISTNDVQFTEHVLTGFVGFIYAELDTTLANKYRLASKVKKLPCSNLQLKFSSRKMSGDAQLAVDYYKKSFNVDEKVRRFYQGWFVEAKEGRTAFLDLTPIYFTYDEQLVLQIHESVKRGAIKEALETLRNQLKCLKYIINKFSTIASDSHAFHEAMSSKNINKTISCIYALCLNDAVQSESCLKTFHADWKNAITSFTEIFVQRGLVGKPFVELLAPEFKTSGEQVTSKTKVQKDKSGNAFNKKLITPIPLSYSDSKAKELIFESIKSDIDHVKFHCREIWNKTMKNLKNFKALAEKGVVRPELVPAGYTNPVDMTKTENICATFKHCGFRHRGNNYSQWLTGNQEANSIDFSTLFALPTLTIMQVFCYLLIEMHPKITPSWLKLWDLFDGKGDLHGYKEVNGVWIALSKKERKGKKLAQQEVILNAESKKLIDEYLELTKELRTQLKQESNDLFRKMLISADSIGSEAKTYIPKSKNTAALVEKLAEVSEDRDSGCKTKTETISISKHVTHARMRSAVGVRVYFETKSVHAMAEALGHDKYRPDQIGKYLPKTLWDYFTNRWIRQFQNAIVYEAMKDSTYLLNAIDLQPDELPTFLENHGLGELPQHIKTGKKKAEDIANDELCEFEDGIILVSTPLLQLFMALTTFVETVSDETKLNQFAKNWYETAKFVLSHISLALENRKGNSVGNAELISDEIKYMYHTAINNPLNHEIIQGVAICQPA